MAGLMFSAAALGRIPPQSSWNFYSLQVIHQVKLGALADINTISFLAEIEEISCPAWLGLSAAGYNASTSRPTIDFHLMKKAYSISCPAWRGLSAAARSIILIFPLQVLLIQCIYIKTIDFHLRNECILGMIDEKAIGELMRGKFRMLEPLSLFLATFADCGTLSFLILSSTNLSPLF